MDPKTEGQNPNTPPPDPLPKHGEGEKDKGKSEPDSFSREYVEDLRKEAAKYRTELRAKEKELEAFSTRDRAAEEKRLLEASQYKELYEKSKAELAEKEAALKAQQLDLLRQRIGSEMKLPQELISRLSGLTDEEIRADAEILVKIVTPATPEGKAGLSGRQTTTAIPDGKPVKETTEQRRARLLGRQATIFEEGDLILPE